MKTFASLFTGLGGADEGAKAAGLTPVWGIELDSRIAAVAHKNGLSVSVDDVLTTCYQNREKPDVLWASPPCQSFSCAKENGAEQSGDIAIADAVCRALKELRPKVFCLENVRGYAGSKSFERIITALKELRYLVDVRLLNAANYGVPQTRVRLILRASRVHDAIPYITPTHSREASFFEQRWVSWYEAISDLIPTLKEGKLAAWQLKKLAESEPISLALLSHQTFGLPIASDQPAGTVTVSDRAAPLLVQGGNTSSNPFTAPNVPAPTVLASERSELKVLDGHRVWKLDGRCLARLQTFPDTYRLEETKTVLYKGLGNAVSCLLAQRVIESMMR